MGAKSAKIGEGLADYAPYDAIGRGITCPQLVSCTLVGATPQTITGTESMGIKYNRRDFRGSAKGIVRQLPERRFDFQPRAGRWPAFATLYLGLFVVALLGVIVSRLPGLYPDMGGDSTAPAVAIDHALLEDTDRGVRHVVGFEVRPPGEEAFELRLILDDQTWQEFATVERFAIRYAARRDGDGVRVLDLYPWPEGAGPDSSPVVEEPDAALFEPIGVDNP